MSDETRKSAGMQPAASMSAKDDAVGAGGDVSALTGKMERASELIGEIAQHATKIAPEYKQIFEDARAAIGDFGTLLISDKGAGSRVTQIVAPMPGVIVRFEKKPGEEVEKGDVLLLLDAMKVENPIRIPATGRLISVRYGEGQRVAKGAVLAVVNHTVTAISPHS